MNYNVKMFLGDNMKYIVHENAANGLIINHLKYVSPKKDAMAIHTHNDYELLYILNGDVSHVIENRKYKLKKDDLVIIKPNSYHFVQIDSSKDYERYNILFNPTSLGINNIDLLPKDIEIINCKHRPIITELFKKTDYYSSVLKNEEFKDMLSMIIKELIYNLSLSDIGEDPALWENIHPLISKAITEINENLFTINSIEEIANKLSVSESYLYRIFKKELKTTPLKYLTEKRLLIAQNLIACGKKPTEVYSECGFLDYTSFYRGFVKLFGYSPSKEGKKI